VLPYLERFIALSLGCMEVPRLTEGNMPSANNAIWSMGELIVRVRIL
jgi:transportin-1